MWTTNNRASRTACSRRRAARGGRVPACRFVPLLGANCELPTPATVSAESRRGSQSELEAAVPIACVGRADRVDSSSKVPFKGGSKAAAESSDGFRRQLAPHAGDDRASGEYVWASDLDGNGGLVVEHIKYTPEAQVRGRGGGGSVMNLTLLPRTSFPKACGGGARPLMFTVWCPRASTPSTGS